MSKLYIASEFKACEGRYCVQCDELVATGRNWVEPARILGITPAEFLIMLRTAYGAILTPYKKDGKLQWVGYHWSTLAQARKWKNFINAKARDKKYLI